MVYSHVNIYEFNYNSLATNHQPIHRIADSNFYDVAFVLYMYEDFSRVNINFPILLTKIKSCTKLANPRLAKTTNLVTGPGIPSV